MTAESAPPAPVPLHRLHFDAPGPPRLDEPPGGAPVWLVSRYADVRQVLSDPRFGRARLFTPEAPPLSDVPDLVSSPDLMFNQDGAAHLRLRRTLRRAFTPRSVARWRPWIAEMVDDLLGRLETLPGPVDAVGAFTLPLPVAVISRLMGLDEPVWERMRYWSEHAFSDGTHDREQVASALEEFRAFGADLVTERRRTPGGDLVSGLVAAADREGGVPDAHLVTLVCGLAVGGHDSTSTMLGNALLYLLGERPGIWPRLGADEEAAGRVADRILHLVPLGDDRGSARHTATDVEVGGVTIPAGATVLADCGRANRDPAVFPPATLHDLFAPLEAPTLSFGAGPHYCLGAWLARCELQLALHRLAARFPGLRLADPTTPVSWRLGATSRSPLRLDVDR